MSIHDISVNGFELISLVSKIGGRCPLGSAYLFLSFIQDEQCCTTWRRVFVLCVTNFILVFPVFYNEVVDSLQRGFEEKLPCGNLILEINSSRYAYNVTLEEVTQLTCKAVFALPRRLSSPIKPLLVYFKPLFANYVKTDSGQRECLSAFEVSWQINQIRRYFRHTEGCQK